MLKAQGIKNGKYVAIKCMKNHFDSHQVITCARLALRLSPHPE